MNDRSVARRYAKAIFELAAEENALDAAHADLALAATVVRETPEMTVSLSSPDLPREQKRVLVKNFVAAAKIGTLTANAIGLLAERGRFELIPDVAEIFGAMKDEREGIVRGTLSSASPLSPGDVAAIQDKLGKSLGKKVVMKVDHEPALIGGIALEIAGRTIDGSIQGQLRAMARALKSG